MEGDFPRSIELGKKILDINRHHEGTYNYLALAYEATGQLDQAVATMKQAERYEAPWDKHNLEHNIKPMLRRLLLARQEKEERNEATKQ